jgi:hypothetical protein
MEPDKARRIEIQVETKEGTAFEWAPLQSFLASMVRFFCFVSSYLFLHWCFLSFSFRSA